MGHVHVSQCAYVPEFHFQHFAPNKSTKWLQKRRVSEAWCHWAQHFSPMFLCAMFLFCTPTNWMPERGYLTMYLTFRVAAEWVLRCGGGVKFKNPEKWIWDYNAIPDGPKGRLALEGINAKGISVTTGGLQHLGNYILKLCSALILVVW